MDQSIGTILLFLTFCAALIAAVLKLAKSDEFPKIYVHPLSGTSRRGYAREILRRCSAIGEKYSPPSVWGRSGHIQTFVHVLLAQTSQFHYTASHRESVVLPDGSTVFFDIFDSLPDAPKSEKEVTILLLPGLGASSESVYLKRFAYHANQKGFRVAITNHLGFLPSHPLTGYKIFTYGSTVEVNAVTLRLKSMYPHSGFIAMGQSMGGNLLMKYLGESYTHQKHFLAAVSICQGYDIQKCVSYLEGDRVGQTYLRYLLIDHVKVIKRFRHILFSAASPFSNLCVNDVLECKSIRELINKFILGMTEYSSFEDYLWASSSCNYMHNITIPVLMINSEDDPLIPKEVLEHPKRLVEKSLNAILVVTQHGGHLGFYEYFTNSGTSSTSFTQWELDRGPGKWLDRLLLQYVSECSRILPVSPSGREKDKGN